MAWVPQNIVANSVRHRDWDSGCVRMARIGGSSGLLAQTASGALPTSNATTGTTFWLARSDALRTSPTCNDFLDQPQLSDCGAESLRRLCLVPVAYRANR
jgi:hypothetical protein